MLACATGHQHDLVIRQNWELVWRVDRCSPALERFIKVAADHLSRHEQPS